MATKKTVKKVTRAKEVLMEKSAETKAKKCCSSYSKNTCSDSFYILGAIGAAIYYISTATGFWNGVLGVLKAMVWPIFLVFELLIHLGA